VVRINQGETPTVEGLAWTPPSQVRSAPSRRPAALLAPPPPFGDLSGGPAPAAAGCSCSLIEPPPKRQNDEQHRTLVGASFDGSPMACLQVLKKIFRLSAYPNHYFLEFPKEVVPNLPVVWHCS